MQLPVQIWSDIACPWCYVGKRRLEAALAELKASGSSVNIEIQWRSFELDPRKKEPSDQGSYVSRLARKYGVSESQAQSMIENMTQTGSVEGLAFDFERAIPANTFDAHRLLKWAPSSGAAAPRSGGDPEGQQGRLKQALFAAHLEEGKDIASHSVLLSLVGAVGLDVDAAAAILASGDFADEVRRDEEEAQMHGVTGVPFFAFGRIAVGGAQRPETLVVAIERAWAELVQAREEEALISEAEGAVCTPEGC